MQHARIPPVVSPVHATPVIPGTVLLVLTTMSVPSIFTIVTPMLHVRIQMAHFRVLATAATLAMELLAQMMTNVR